MINTNVGKRIREYREKANLTQEEVAEILDLSITAVSNIERGLNYPTMENFIKLANIMNVSSDLLLSDVLKQSYIAKSSELSEKIKSLSAEKQKQLFAIIEAFIASEE